MNIENGSLTDFFVDVNRIVNESFGSRFITNVYRHEQLELHPEELGIQHSYERKEDVK